MRMTPLTRAASTVVDGMLDWQWIWRMQRCCREEGRLLYLSYPNYWHYWSSYLMHLIDNHGHQHGHRVSTYSAAGARCRHWWIRRVGWKSWRPPHSVPFLLHDFWQSSKLIIRTSLFIEWINLESFTTMFKTKDILKSKHMSRGHRALAKSFLSTLWNHGRTQHLSLILQTPSSRGDSLVASVSFFKISSLRLTPLSSFSSFAAGCTFRPVVACIFTPLLLSHKTLTRSYAKSRRMPPKKKEEEKKVLLGRPGNSLKSGIVCRQH